MNRSILSARRDRLRIAIQKSGRLTEPSRQLLTACGFSWRQSRDKLFCFGDAQPIDLLLVRDDDIPGLIAQGVCDLGILGRNEFDEQTARRNRQDDQCPQQCLRQLNFGQCRLMLAVPEHWDWQGIAQLQGQRIATSYPGLLRQWLDKHAIAAQIVELSGSVEIAPRVGTADVICDLVSSGATLSANQLKPVQTLLESQAILAGVMQPSSDARAPLLALLLRRLDAVLQRHERKLLMFRAHQQQLQQLTALLPDADPLETLPDDGSGHLRLQTMCHGTVSWQRLEALERAGAQALTVLSVECVLA